MPKQTFFNLPINKQELLLEISKKEFSNNLFNDVSINKIIKECNISRGSFYTYFEDKEDLYYYLLKTVHEKMFDLVKEIMLKNNGYLKNSFIELFEVVTNRCNDNNLFMQKVFLNANNKNDEQLFIRNCDHKKSILQEIEKIVMIDSNYEKSLILKLHFMIFTQNMIKLIKERDSKEKIKEEFIKELEIIETGYKGGRK